MADPCCGRLQPSPTTADLAQRCIAMAVSCRLHENDEDATPIPALPEELRALASATAALTPSAARFAAEHARDVLGPTLLQALGATLRQCASCCALHPAEEMFDAVPDSPAAGTYCANCVRRCTECAAWYSPDTGDHACPTSTEGGSSDAAGSGGGTMSSRRVMPPRVRPSHGSGADALLLSTLAVHSGGGDDDDDDDDSPPVLAAQASKRRRGLATECAYT